MRISDWSSDVCSSDLRNADATRGRSFKPQPPSRIEMAGSFGNEMTVPITPLRPFGLAATAAFVDENRYHQARKWHFARDGNRLLLSGASRRVAPRPPERLSASGWDFVRQSTCLTCIPS